MLVVLFVVVVIDVDVIVIVVVVVIGWLLLLLLLVVLLLLLPFIVPHAFCSISKSVYQKASSVFPAQQQSFRCLP